jgi:aspartyl-tRNA(Asn)/glutamyl-tRNA(Gln) amidotransferase subunit A
MSLPVGLSASGLPMGLQLITGSLLEENLFNIATALERGAGFKAKPIAC